MFNQERDIQFWHVSYQMAGLVDERMSYLGMIKATPSTTASSSIVMTPEFTHPVPDTLLCRVVIRQSVTFALSTTSCIFSTKPTPSEEIPYHNDG